MSLFTTFFKHGRVAETAEAEELAWDHKRRLAASARLPIQEAIQIAQCHLAGTVMEAGLEGEDERPVWAVAILTAEGSLKEIRIDSQTGMLL